MKQKAQKNNAGFTLIELLVVISIMGLLPTTAMAALNTARTKARNSKRIADARAVINALEVYHTNNGLYPEAPLTKCLGYTNESCYFGLYQGDTVLLTKFSTVLSGVPTTFATSGLAQNRLVYNSATPNKYYLTWFYEGAMPAGLCPITPKATGVIIALGVPDPRYSACIEEKL